MKFDPEVEAMFAKSAAQSSLDTSSTTLADSRRGYVEQSAMTGGPVIEMAQITDLTADGPGGTIPLRLYRPEGAPDTDGGALIYFHGGGWVIGSIQSHDRVCRQIAHRAGCSVISVEYRLAPEHPAPASAYDAIAAVQWISDHANSLGLSRNRLGVGGDSAGGGLAAVAALGAREAGIPLQCQILIYPGLDNRDTVWSNRSRVAYAEVPPLTRQVMKSFMSSFLPDTSKAEDWHVSPAIADDVTGVAPALVITGSCDALHDEAVTYITRLSDADVPVIHRNFPGMIHGFIEMAGVLTAANLALDTIAFVLRERLAPTAR